MTLSGQILTVLRRVGKVGLTASVLADELAVRLGRRPGESEVADGLHRLADKGLARHEPDPVTDDQRWSLTPEGDLRAR